MHAPMAPKLDTTRRSAPMCVLAAVLALGLATHPVHAQSQSAGPPPAVMVMPVTDEDVSRTDQFVGRVTAIQTVNLVARVEGFLEKVNFKEGAYVKKGDTLLEIEKAPYEAALAQAQAQLASAQASVTAAQTQLKNDQTIADRQAYLVKRDAVSQAKADDANAQRDVSAARVQEAEASVKQAEAQVQTAKLNLSYTDVVAPISGRVGALSITEGNLVSTQSGTIVTINQLDPIRVAFSIPETLYTDAADRAVHGTGKMQDQVDLFTPQLVLPNGKTYNEAGKISFVSNEISATTGTLVVYADFPNPSFALLPGAFVTMDVRESEGQKLPVVPASAVLQDRQGRYVFVVDHNSRAEQRRIETGEQIENGFPVTHGLQAGETVIVQGLQKVSNGIEVTPTPMKASDPAAATASAEADASSSSATAANNPPASSTSAAPAGSSGSSGAADAASTTAAPSDNGTADTSAGSDASAASDSGTTSDTSATTSASDSTTTSAPAGDATDSSSSTAPSGGDGTASDAGGDTASAAPAASTTSSTQ